MSRRAVILLRDNIRYLLKDRGHTQRDLAFVMRVHPTTINKFLKGTREVQLSDLDAIANFFGVESYQLFQPGVTRFTERRTGKDRRSGHDRRVSHATMIRDRAYEMRRGSDNKDHRS